MSTSGNKSTNKKSEKQDDSGLSKNQGKNIKFRLRLQEEQEALKEIQEYEDHEDFEQYYKGHDASKPI